MRLLWNSNAPMITSGYGTQTALLVPRLAGLGHDVTISAPYSAAGFVMEWEGVTVLPGGLDPYGSDTIDAHYKWAKADLMITLCDVFAMATSKLRDLNVAHWMPVDCAPLGDGDKRKLEESGGVPVAFSRFGQTQLRDAGFDPLYVPHAIDTGLFTPLDPIERDRLREDMGIGASTFLIGMNAINKQSGNRKAFPEQLLAFQKFHERHPNSMLALHTNVNTKPLGGLNLREITDRLGITDCVMFPGQHAYVTGMVGNEVMAQWYQCLDLLTSCSLAEGFGLPVVEAQASGVPVVVTDCSAMTELCGSGWKVKGQPTWETGHAAWWMCPSVTGIIDAYEQAYSEWPANDARRKEAREFALGYDVDKVFREYWVPVLAQIEARIAAKTSPVSIAAEYQRRLGVRSDIQDNLRTLHNTVTQYSAPRVLELGVRSGNSTSALLAAVEETGGHLWSVDIAEPEVPAEWARSTLWTFTQGDDMDPGVVAAQPQKVEVLFLDVDPHSFEQTLAELRLYVPRVRSGGVVLAHDTKFAPHDGFPVARALAAFCEETGLVWAELGGEFGLGQIMIP